MKAKKWDSTFWKKRDYGYFSIIVLCHKKLLLKLDCLLKMPKTISKLKDEFAVFN